MAELTKEKAKARANARLRLQQGSGQALTAGETEERTLLGRKATGKPNVWPRGHDRGPSYRERVTKQGLPVEGEGGSTSARLAASAGTIEDVRRKLGDQFGIEPQDVEVGRSEGVGLVFRNPETGEYEPLNPPGVDLSDVIVGASEVPVIAGEIIGGVAGLRGGVPGVVAGSASGAATGRGLQRGALDYMGIIDPDAGDYARDVVTEGGLAAGGALLPTAGRIGKSIFTPKTRALDLLRKQGVRPEELEEGARRLEEAMGPDVQTSAGQRLSEVNPDIGPRVRGTETAYPEYTGEYGRRASQRQAEEEARETVSPVRERDFEQTGESIRREAGVQAEQRRESVEEATRREIAQQRERMAEVSGPDLPTAGANIRQRLEEGRNEIFQRMSDEYQTLWDEVPETARADLSGVRRTAEKWQGRLNERVFKSLSQEDKRIVTDALDNLSATDPNLGTGRRLATISDELSALKEERRALAKGSPRSNLKEKRLLDDMIRELEGARQQALSNVDPAIARQVKALDRKWAEASQRIDEGTVGSILARKNARDYKVSDDDVLRNVTRTRSGVRDYLDLARDYPELNATSDLKAAFRGRYQEEVVEGGKTHEAFMRQNRGTMQEIFDEGEMKRFRSAGEAKDFIRTAEKREQDLLSEMRQEFEYKLSTYDPETAVRVAYGSPAKTRKLKRMLKDDPDKWEAYQDVRRARLVENPNDMNKVFSDDEYRREVEIALGEDYVRNLERLRNLGRLQEAKTAASLDRRQATDTAETTFGAARRLIYGPLSREGFMVRTLGRFQQAATDRAMMDLLKDPDLLAQALRLRNAQVNDRAYQNLLSALGISTAALTDAQELDAPELDQEEMRAAPSGQ